MIGAVPHSATSIEIPGNSPLQHPHNPVPIRHRPRRLQLLPGRADGTGEVGPGAPIGNSGDTILNY